MPWYKPIGIALQYDHSNYGVGYFKGSIFQPFKFNNVIYDYDTFPDDYYTYFGTNTNTLKVEYISVSLSNIYNSKKYTFANINKDNNWYHYGLPFMMYNKRTLESRYITLVDTKNINGRYKLKGITKRFPDELMAGATLKINFQINGKNYKYLTTSSTADFSGSLFVNGNNYYIGGYNELPILDDHTTNYNLLPPADIEFYSVISGSNIIIDFGNNNQEIPSNFYDWFIQNFEQVYENTYTIKSVTGSTLTTLTEAPPMISTTLSTVGNAKYLTLKGENNTNYTMEWTSETPQGKIFAGLATSKGGSIVISVGETSTINLTESTDLYEVWQTYRPPTTTFEIKTYNYSGETSRVDKTDYLTPISTISGVLREEASLLNFNVLIQSDTVPNFNYCYIDKFKRYYYVTEPVSVRQNLWELTMQVDALMTYKDSLLKCEGYIDRNEYIQNKMIIDNNRAIMQGADFEEDTITNELFGSGTFALSGLRIGTKELP